MEENAELASKLKNAEKWLDQKEYEIEQLQSTNKSLEFQACYSKKLKDEKKMCEEENISLKRINDEFC